LSERYGRDGNDSGNDQRLNEFHEFLWGVCFRKRRFAC
jgi:hypothetical protein